MKVFFTRLQRAILKVSSILSIGFTSSYQEIKTAISSNGLEEGEKVKLEISSLITVSNMRVK